jgi:Fis family transcriptional regulator, factor for inversion stimulation protein
MQSKHSLREEVKKALHHYFSTLDGAEASNLYQLVITEIEPALLEVIMQYTKGNQSKAAQWLGLNRGTLRKLLEKYRLL